MLRGTAFRTGPGDVRGPQAVNAEDQVAHLKPGQPELPGFMKRMK
jgi:hypothetical protein